MRNSGCSSRRGRGQGWEGWGLPRARGWRLGAGGRVPAQCSATDWVPGAVLRQGVRTPSCRRADTVTSKVVAAVGREGVGRSLGPKL